MFFSPDQRELEIQSKNTGYWFLDTGMDLRMNFDIQHQASSNQNLIMFSS